MIRRSKCELCAGAIAIALLAHSLPASAQSEGDRASAEVLFSSARELVDHGDFAAGCPKFEAALKLVPSASTMINIGRCHEHDGKLATAWADYKRALALNVETQGIERQKALEDVAKQALASVDQRVPKLKISFVEQPPGLRLLRDGAEMHLATLDEALPLDAGEHSLEASAPGRKTEKRQLLLEEGKTTTVELVLLPEGEAAARADRSSAVAPEPAPLAPTGGRRTDVGVCIDGRRRRAHRSRHRLSRARSLGDERALFEMPHRSRGERPDLLRSRL